MNVFSGHTGPVTCGRFLPDGKRLITGSEDGSFIIWDPKTSSPVHKLSSNDGRFRMEGGVTALAFNGNGTSAIVGGADGGLRIVNLTNGQMLSVLEGHEEDNSVEAVAWFPGPVGSAGLWISAGTDKKVKVFEASNGSVRWTGSHDVGLTERLKREQGCWLRKIANIQFTLSFPSPFYCLLRTPSHRCLYILSKPIFSLQVVLIKQYEHGIFVQDNQKYKQGMMT